MKNIEIKPWNLAGFDMKKPILIAGPCSAETEQQTLTTAHQLASQGIKLLEQEFGSRGPAPVLLKE